MPAWSPIPDSAPPPAAEPRKRNGFAWGLIAVGAVLAVTGALLLDVVDPMDAASVERRYMRLYSLWDLLSNRGLVVLGAVLFLAGVLMRERN